MKRLRIAGAVAVMAAIAAGTTYATTALTTGAAATSTIQACVKKENGQVRIVDSATQCHRDERSTTWNVVGPQGPKGDTGAQGVKGDDGLSVTASALAPGDDPSCAGGGSKFRVGTAAPTYACNGAPGKDGTSFTSIEGLRGLTCTSGGTAGTVSVAVGPGGVVTLTCTTSGGGGSGGGGGGNVECGTPPTYPNGAVSCSNGTYAYTCNAGFADADANPANGCEVNLMTDPNNCGGIGIPATLPHAVTGCVNGHPVVLTCMAGWSDVNGIAADGCEVDTFCAHPNGLGGSYGDCTDALGTPGDPTTYNLRMAELAARSWSATATFAAAGCASGTALLAVDGPQSAVWQVAGPTAGHVYLATGGAPALCPTATDPTWR